MCGRILTHPFLIMKRFLDSSSFGMETINVGSEVYVVTAPTVGRLIKVGEALGELDEASDIMTILQMVDRENKVKALSFLIAGDESLVNTLSGAEEKEIDKGLATALGFVNISTAPRMNAIIKNVSNLISRPV